MDWKEIAEAKQKEINRLRVIAKAGTLLYNRLDKVKSLLIQTEIKREDKIKTIEMIKNDMEAWELL